MRDFLSNFILGIGGAFLTFIILSNLEGLIPISTLHGFYYIFGFGMALIINWKYKASKSQDRQVEE